MGLLNWEGFRTNAFQLKLHFLALLAKFGAFSLLSAILITTAQSYGATDSTPKGPKSVQKLCPLALTNPHDILSVDPKYAELIQQTDDRSAERIRQTPPLLNQALFPIILDLVKSLESMSDETLTSQVDEVLHTIRIRTSSYQQIMNDLGESRPENDYPENWEAKNILNISASQAASTHKMLQRPGVDHFSNFIFTDFIRKKDRYPTDSVFGMAITPIGPYGADFARAMLIATKVLAEIAERTLPLSSQAVWSKNPNLLANETARGREGAGLHMGSEERAPIAMVIEGALSLNQLFNLVVGERVVGVKTGSQALDLFVNSRSSIGLASEIVARVPLGLVAPSIMSGYYFKNALELSAAGQLEMTASFKDTLKTIRADAESGGRVPRGVCPMASCYQGQKAEAQEGDGSHRFAPDRETGVQKLATAYLRIFHVVERQTRLDQ